jgi:hypothetical protein
MAALDSSDYTLRYQAIPPEKCPSILGPIRDALLSRKFDPSSIRPDYIFTAPEGKVGLKVHQATFTDPKRWDPTTSAINFYYNPDKSLSDIDILKSLALSGAPFNLIGGDDAVSLYVLSQNGEIQIEPVETNIAYDQVSRLFADFAADIAPQRIHRVKRGVDSFVKFSNFNALQLSLFAVEVTRKTLVDQFRAAISILRSAVNEPLESYSEVKVAIQLLAAVILAHKGVLGDKCSEQNASMNFVIGRAWEKFSRYFTPSLISQYGDAAESAYAILQQVRYSSFTPDILEELYIQAYPQIDLRKREGRYNTPPYLTHRILDNIPLETIPPDQRVVADMTCGVGNFLQAAYERLSGLTDMEDSGKPLREHIIGNDWDPPTTELASMSLLLTSHTDLWRVDREDALEWSWLSQNRPTIIVGNPPFGGSRKSGDAAIELDSATGKRKRYQKADEFLTRAVERLAPGGYLAMVMPQSFVVAEASPSTRRLLLENCDVLEIWELPNEVFPGATVRPMVLFAQRRREAGRILTSPVRVRTVQEKTLNDFKQEGTFTASSVVASQAEWGSASRRGRKNTHLMRYQLILSPTQWSTIRRRAYKLCEVTDITQGAIVGSRSRSRWTEYEHPKEVKWLSQPKKSMPRPYCIEYSNETKTYPNDFEWPRKNLRYPHLDKEYLLAGDKVLLVSDPDPTWGQRVKVAIERKGYYPSDSFWVLAPWQGQPKHITLEVLAAVVSWYVSNAWIIEHMKAPKVPSDALESVPFPRELKAADCQKLEAAVRQLEAAARYNQEAGTAKHTIDEILKVAYQLDDVTYERLRMVANWDEINSGALKKPRPNPAKLLFVTGGVEDIDAQNETITVWINGFSGLHKTQIADEMPGWMLRPGATFRAEISEESFRQQSLDGVTWAYIMPQEHTYLTEDELLDRLDATFSELLSSTSTSGS